MIFSDSDIEELKKQLNNIEEVRTKGFFSKEFQAWKMKTSSLIERVSGSDSSYMKNFFDITYDIKNSTGPTFLKQKAFEVGLEQSKVLISETLNFAEQQRYTQSEKRNTHKESVQFIINLCYRFPRISQILTAQYRKQREIQITDEYDVQHIFHAFLSLKFDDIRPEDVNPSFAGATSRVDFLLKEEKIVVEIKKTRNGLNQKEVGEQLIVDIQRYSSSPDCKNLICFVYDPDGFINNPTGLENDLSGRYGDIEVKVIVEPKK